MYISQKPKLTCRSCSALNQHHKLFANINEVTWKQLEDYLVQNYCEYLASCDVYCNGFVVIKNSGSRPNLMNKSKILTFNAKLVKDSKIGSKFLQVTYIANNVCDHSDFDLYRHCSWKFIIIHNDQSDAFIRES